MNSIKTLKNRVKYDAAKNSLLKFCACLCVSLVFALSSCSAKIEGTLKEGGAASLSVTAALEPRAEGLIRSLKGFLGEKDTSVLDGEAIGLSLTAASGISSALFRNTAPSALEGIISVSSVGDFLAGGKSRLVTLTEGQGASSLVINLDRDSAPELISRLSPEAEEYLSALLAPVVLGEKSSKQEYLALVAAIYGRPLANEIAAARIRASIEFPRPLKEVKGGISSGRKAEFDISLVDILVLEQPLRYELSW